MRKMGEVEVICIYCMPCRYYMPDRRFQKVRFHTREYGYDENRTKWMGARVRGKLKTG